MPPQERPDLKSDAEYAAELERLRIAYSPDEEGYVRLETVSAFELNSSAQYVGRFIGGTEQEPALGADLDVLGDLDDFSGMRMRLEDVPVFLSRIAKHKKEQREKLLRNLGQ